MKRIFCPINITNTHWAMCVIHMTEKRIQVRNLTYLFKNLCSSLFILILVVLAVLRLNDRVGGSIQRRSDRIPEG